MQTFPCEIELPEKIINDHVKQVIRISDCIPIIIQSICSQLKLGKTMRRINESLAGKKDQLFKFCFESQFKHILMVSNPKPEINATRG